MRSILQVKRVRSKFKYNDEVTNVGHIVAAEYNNHYPEGAHIKLLVHPLVKGGTSNAPNRNSASDSGIEMTDAMTEQNGINNEKGQIEGYGPPVVFTCDSKSPPMPSPKSNPFSLIFKWFFFFIFCSLYNSRARNIACVS